MIRKAKARTNKYRAKAVVIDGIRFASLKEGTRYNQLKTLLKAGQITDLEIHPMFEIRIKDIKICRYYADFMYKEKGSTDLIVEDVKGVKTPVYKLKKKMVEAEYGITIVEV